MFSPRTKIMGKLACFSGVISIALRTVGAFGVDQARPASIQPETAKTKSKIAKTKWGKWGSKENVNGYIVEWEKASAELPFSNIGRFENSSQAN